MVKIFVGNLSSNTKPEEIEDLFGRHGKVLECAVLGSYGFVHMSSDDAETAIKHLDKREVCGRKINVEISSSKGSRKREPGLAYSGGDFRSKQARRAGCTKLHIGNVPPEATAHKLRRLFERYGFVAECDIVGSIAFVHIEGRAADEAIRGLDGFSIAGKEIKVSLSKNQDRERFRGPPPDRRPSSRHDSNLDMRQILAQRRQEVDSLHPYEYQLAACTDAFNLPLPPLDYLRQLRNKVLDKMSLLPPPKILPIMGNNASIFDAPQFRIPRNLPPPAAIFNERPVFGNGRNLLNFPTDSFNSRRVNRL